MTAIVSNHAFGLSCGSGGVENVKRVGCSNIDAIGSPAFKTMIDTRAATQNEQVTVADPDRAVWRLQVSVAATSVDWSRVSGS